MTNENAFYERFFLGVHYSTLTQFESRYTPKEIYFFLYIKNNIENAFQCVKTAYNKPSSRNTLCFLRRLNFVQS